ncbi:hypothetical protein BO70DRAFT_355929 [Aspergillus heteromorphus CBS 117.55]|uniref:Thioesterase family protein n=1 Tax=Aspergillus heteromorphus CBS 117.55 TaxID=1448321 RepID=A0A317V881_9EURO|nr:uncharacterized protein BO70DRAFT_355929 [Aspergillus heteromorphus CBS 117.55]PWY69589.1 hypothetical protein BO70DRAFT_355929 [Aspergillus heteromorphus CBS 117.55]
MGACYIAYMDTRLLPTSGGASSRLQNRVQNWTLTYIPYLHHNGLRATTSSAMSPAHGSVFEAAIQVTPLGSHRYSAHLEDAWCIGSVPHGGYTSSVLYRLALVHFAQTHPTLYNGPATPITMQLAFLRRTAVGPAVLTVQDTKLGRRTSTVHVTLSQPPERKKTASKNNQAEELEVKVAGYITVSPAHAEVGLTTSTGWELSPPPPPGSQPDGTVHLAALGDTGRDGAWTRFSMPFPSFRRATAHAELYGPDPASAPVSGQRTVVDQWARFRPNGDVSSRWTNEALVYLTDLFPGALSEFDDMATTSGDQGHARNWYPTVTLNIDLKRRLPAEGVEWLYSRVQTKLVREGRTDLDVTVLDGRGQVVALSTQVGLVVSASRNIGGRQKL